MKSSTRPQYHRRQRILELIREGRRAGSLPNCGHFMRELAVSRRTVMRDRGEAEEGALAVQLLHPGVGDFIEGVELVSEASMTPTSNFQHRKAGHSHPKPEVIRDWAGKPPQSHNWAKAEILKAES